MLVLVSILCTLNLKITLTYKLAALINVISSLSALESGASLKKQDKENKTNQDSQPVPVQKETKYYSQVNLKSATCKNELHYAYSTVYSE